MRRHWQYARLQRERWTCNQNKNNPATAGARHAVQPGVDSSSASDTARGIQRTSACAPDHAHGCATNEGVAEDKLALETDYPHVQAKIAEEGHGSRGGKIFQKLTCISGIRRARMHHAIRSKIGRKE